MTDKTKKIWIEDGILFAEYVNTVTGEDVVAREKIAVEMLDQANIKIIPFILILTNVDLSRFTIKLSDYAQILTSFGFMKRINCIWMVGVPESIKNHVLPIIGKFYGKRLFFADSLEHAKIEAKKFISHPSPLLE
jgi:uncharacterized protein YaaQ